MQPRASEISIGRGVLQAIFAVFLGLMIAAVVGVGVYTFHPNRADTTQEQIDELYAERGRIDGCGANSPSQCRSWDQLSQGERQQVTAIDAHVAALQGEARSQREAWSQSTSIILISVATVLMVISLLLGESLTVLSNGILLGGLFTMLYGVGWGIASGNSLTRFLVLVAALVVSLLLGYLKFARNRVGRATGPAPAATAGLPLTAGVSLALDPSGVVDDLAARVTSLELRLTRVATLLAEDGASPEAESPRA
ncbi:MAG: hypothetical protein WCF12_14265 [Propionicimonas sp.]